MASVNGDALLTRLVVTHLPLSGGDRLLNFFKTGLSD
jgi:hypothetical protein